MAGRVGYFCDSARHLVCLPYSIPNLHRMADVLGIKRCWFHPGRLAHYDIPKRRVAEIHTRSEVVTSKDILSIIVHGKAPSPKAAPASRRGAS